jgi:hypothetical protein
VTDAAPDGIPDRGTLTRIRYPRVEIRSVLSSFAAFMWHPKSQMKAMSARHGTCIVPEVNSNGTASM